MAREQTQRMSRIHHECLFVSHRSEVLHDKAVLGPVLEHGSVTSICDQFVRMLCHAVVEIVLDHRHDRSRLTRLGRIFIYRPGIHLVVRTEAVHVDTSVLLQLLCEFLGQNFVVLCWEVPECVPDRQHLLLVAQYLLALRSMVYDRVIWLRLRQYRRNTCQYIFFKSHCIL